MIENPTAGQRVWCPHYEESGVIQDVLGGNCYVWFPRLESVIVLPAGELMTTESAAAALRTQAAELIAAAERLEQEGTNAN